ncbi:MAG: molecular chaperone HtpG, partial [Myxococcales bacterium]|nr:molecular chaperone HtpG [Myxococcales bacterium]
LFVPKRPPLDLFTPDGKHGVRLYVKRVFIEDDCAELLPKWLRFVRGIVDSEDLPLNVSREMLQDSSIVRTMRKQVIKKSLEMIEEIAKGDAYDAFWRAYGAVLKEGLHFEPTHRERLSKLLRFESSAGEGWVSLSEYVERMKEGQPAIYYALGASREIAAGSPHLEALQKRGYEILYMTDAVDQWAVDGLEKFEDKPLVSAMEADLSIEAEGAEDGAADARGEALGDLLGRFREVLGEHISEVRISSRLTDSPACLVIPRGGLPPYLERLMRLSKEDLPAQKRILELNPTHPITERLRALLAAGDADAIEPWIHLLHDQALLAEGSPIEQPGRFAKRLADLMVQAMPSPEETPADEA